MPLPKAFEEASSIAIGRGGSDFSIALEQVVSLLEARSYLDEIGSASTLHSDRIFSNAIAQTPYPNYFYFYNI